MTGREGMEGMHSVSGRVPIPVAVTARNEAAAIGPCLEALIRSVEHAERELGLGFDVLVVLDHCTDGTAEIARSWRRVRIIEIPGGSDTDGNAGGNIVEAQRQVRSAAPFVVYCDADLSIEPETIAALARALLDDPGLQVAYPRKTPLRPRRRSLLAESLYSYNLHDGFQTRRHYFNGKLFAIRDWRIPTLEELGPRLAAIAPDPFYDYHAGMRVDDIYLSRDVLGRYGPGAIREVPRGRIWYRPPETFEGMYRTYRRMRMEIERLDELFPATQEVHRRYGVRRRDRDALRRARRTDRWLWRVFQLALAACKIRYAVERFYYRHFSRETCPAWQPVRETKRPILSDGDRAV